MSIRRHIRRPWTVSVPPCPECRQASPCPEPFRPRNGPLIKVGVQPGILVGGNAAIIIRGLRGIEWVNVSQCCAHSQSHDSFCKRLELSEILRDARLPWNLRWNGEAIMVPEAGKLPSVTLEGGLRLTVLGPTFPRLYKLCTAWPDVLGGTDAWPPVWKDEEQRDPSVANGSSIMLLAELGSRALLLAGDGHEADLAAALKRLSGERNPASASSLVPLAAFKLSHHASQKNLTRTVLRRRPCCRPTPT
jgi:hypothetical protein